MEDNKAHELLNAEDYRKDVSYALYRDLMVRYENTVKRFIVAIVILVIAFMALFALREAKWIDFINGYDFSSESYVIDSSDEGNANYLETGNDGVINNGENSSDEKNDD